MFRTLTIAAALAAAALALAVPPAQAARRDALTADAARALRTFRAAARDADSGLATAMRSLSRGLDSGATTTEQAATTFGDAVAYLAEQLAAAADTAGLELSDAAVSAMDANGDDAARGTNAGDGGSYDGAVDAIRGDLARLRSKTSKRIAAFGRTLAKKGGARVALRGRLEAWTFTPQPVPRGGGAFGVRDRPLQLWGVLATRLTDGRVIATAFGTAPRSRSGDFDVRLDGPVVRFVGTEITAGGMPVAVNGTWRATTILNDPFDGDGVAAGNHAVLFGVDPVDVGIAGRQPARYEHAGAISVP